MRCKYKHVIKLALFFFLSPAVVQAACSASGYTVVFVNGIQNTKEEAENNKLELRKKLGDIFNGQPVDYITGYNESHLQGAGDLVEAVLPQFDDHDLQTILMQIHDEVHTRKLLIVGHSQGSVYANKIYDYLVTHGEPAGAIGVYVVATPDPSPIAGGGKYLNYQGDNIIYSSNLQVGAVVPPPPNIFYKDWWADPNAKGPVTGHSFIGQYLANFAGRITSEIKSGMFVLRSTAASETGECFQSPKKTLGYKAASVGLAIAEPIAVGVKVTGKVVSTVASAAVSAYDFAYSAVGSMFAGVFGAKPSDPDKERAVNDTGIALLHALNLTSLDAQTADQLQRDTQKKSNNSQGGAAILALMPDEPQAQGEVLGSSTDSAGSRQAEAADTVAFPAPPTPMPGENVHYNAPAFGGPQAVQEEVSPNPPPDTPAVVLTAPTIAFSNWRPQGGFQSPSCNPGHHESDLSWDAVPTATYYDLYEDDGSPSPLFLGTTTATTWLTPFVFNSNTQTTATVVARDAGGNAATSSVLANNQLADQQPPNFPSLSPEFAAVAVPVDRPIVLTSNEPLATSTIVGTNFSLFQLDEAGGQTLLDSSASLGADNITVTLVPSLQLRYATGYRLVISCKIADVWGNGLSNDISLSPRYFTTEADPAAVVE